jgi:hypothetical protein
VYPLVAKTTFFARTSPFGVRSRCVAPRFSHVNTGEATWGEERVLLEAQSFNQRVQTALVALGNTSANSIAAEAALTIQDFLSGQAGLCTAGGLEDPLSCIDEAKAACGLALYRKAILEELFEIPSTAIGENGDELFCEAYDSRANCRGSNPGLIAYQEHNRFYQELSQAYTYSAQNELSDALFTVVRDGVGALESYNAFGYKETKLVNALGQYDNLREMIYSAASARVLHAWPMGNFKTIGRSWLDQMHNVAVVPLMTAQHVSHLLHQLQSMQVQLQEKNMYR